LQLPQDSRPKRSRPMIVGIRLRGPCQVKEFVVRPGRQRQAYQRFGQHSTLVRSRGGEMRKGTVGSLIN